VLSVLEMVLWRVGDTRIQTKGGAIMKTFALVVAGGLVLAGTAAHAVAGGKTDDVASRPYFSDSASHARVDVDKAASKYKLCLTCGNEGAVESALAHVAWMKIMRPDANLDEMRVLIDQLSVAGATPTVRYKAYLTFLVFDQPAMFAQLKQGRYGSSDEFYAAVAKTLRTSLLGYNDRKLVWEW
jgi:hypothetical protein